MWNRGCNRYGSLSSPGSRAGSAIAKSFSPAFDRHGRACRTTSGESSYVKSSRSTTCTHSGSRARNGMTRCPHGLRREWIVVAGNQEYRRMRARHAPGESLQALPKSQARVLDRRTGPRRIAKHAPRYGAQRRGCSRSRPCVLVTAFSAHPLGTTGTCARGASRRCAAASARRLPGSVGRFERSPRTMVLPSAVGTEARGICPSIFCRPHLLSIPGRRFGDRDSRPWWPTDRSLPQSDLWRWNPLPRHVARVRNLSFSPILARSRR